MKTGSIPIALALCAILTGCQTNSIETRGVPKCSGTDRRPLNSDMWEWQKKEPEAAAVDSAKVPASAQQGSQATGYLPVPDREEPFDQVLGATKPRWNIEGSYEECGEGK